MFPGSLFQYLISGIWKTMEMMTSKGPHIRNDNRIQSLESQVNLCMHGVIVLPKAVNFYSDWNQSTSISKLMIVACGGALRKAPPSHHVISCSHQCSTTTLPLSL